MKLDLDRNSGNFIRGFSGDQILIGSEIFREPVIITIDHLIRDWAPPAVPQLTLAHLQPALDLDPEVILLGTGAEQCFPPMTLISEILTLGVGLEIMNTAAACRTFNVLASEYRRVAAALMVG